jgi:hypothetical protein
MIRKTKNRTRRRPATETSHHFEKLEPRNLLAAVFSSFSVADGSLDDTANTTFESSSLTLDYDVDVTGTSLNNVQVFANQGTDTVKIGEYSALDLSGGIISLDGFSNLAGTQNIFAVASTTDGYTATSDPVSIDVLPTTSLFGIFTADTFNYTAGADSAYVYHGHGGTDTLSLNVNQSSVTGINGAALSAYDRDAFVTSQAFYEGSVYDYLTLDNGSEIYLQGIERLEFNGGSVVDLTTRPNDPFYPNQWEHAIGDVPDAWKFTRGSEEVLIVSLDTGTQTINGTPVYSSDLDPTRYEFELPNDNKSLSNGTHGHACVSIMSSAADNGLGIAGINLESDVLVTDVYSGLSAFSINDAIQIALDKIDNTVVKRVVFQGGIQGEYWLQPDSLDQTLLANNQESLLFAVAAGNGGQDISLTTNSTFSGGVARLEGTFENVMAIGALTASQTFTHGIANATGVALAGYSNFGPNLTFAVSTNTPYIGIDDSIGTFGGTSNANPVMAAFSSLVWSVNSDLSAGEVREIFADTVMDLGTAGRDDTFGWGTPDTGRAVRRAWALNQNPALANLSRNAFAGTGTGVTSVVDSDSSANTVAEDAVVGATVGILADANDPDSGDSVTYALLDDAGGLFSINVSTGVVTVAGALDFETATSHTISVQAESTDGSSSMESFSINVTDVSEATLVSREIYYRGSVFDDGASGALASDKSVLLPGETATFDNYTSYYLGINGFVIDVQGFSQTPTLATVGNFFEFSVGNDDNAAGWASAPAPTGLTYQTNVNGTGSDRIVLEWADNAIQNTWLEIKALANASTGLATEDVFYIGNAIGETGNDPANARVNLADVGLARGNQTGLTLTDILNVYDINRDRRVNLIDVGLIRGNQTGFSPLELITPAANRSAAGVTGSDSSGAQANDGRFVSVEATGARFQFDFASLVTQSEEPTPAQNFGSLVEGLDRVMVDGFATNDLVLIPANERYTNTKLDVGEIDLAEVDFDRLKQLDSAFSVGTI